MVSRLFCLSLMLLSLKAYSQDFQPSASNDCSDFLLRNGVFQFQRIQFNDRSCFLSADPFTASANMKYRSYLFANDGLMMVFNSYNVNESASSHGARVFFFFPRNNTPDIKIQSTQTILKSATRGIEFVLSANQQQLIGMKGGKALESPQISPNNAGGVELSNVKTLYLDAGFRLGEDPTGDAKRNSEFIDSDGRRCPVKNSEVFKYSSDQDPDFKFTDSELKLFLSKRCPELKVNF